MTFIGLLNCISYSFTCNECKKASNSIWTKFWKCSLFGILCSAQWLEGEPLVLPPARRRRRRHCKERHCFSALSFVRFFVESSSWLSSHVDCNGKSGGRQNKNRRKKSELLKVSRSRNKIVMPKLIPKPNETICFSILKSSYILGM